MEGLFNGGRSLLGFFTWARINCRFGSFLFSCWLDLEFVLSGLLCSGLVWSMYFHGFCSWLGFNFIALLVLCLTLLS